MVPCASSHHDRLLRVIIVVVEEVDWIVEADKTSTAMNLSFSPKREGSIFLSSLSHSGARQDRDVPPTTKQDRHRRVLSALIQRPPNQ